MTSKNVSLLQNRLRQQRFYTKNSEEVNAKKRAKYSQWKQNENTELGIEQQGIQSVVMEEITVPPQQPPIPPPQQQTDTVENGVDCFRILQQCSSIQKQRNQAWATLYCLEDDELSIKEPLSDKQKEIATDVVILFDTFLKLLFVMIVAPTQSGKTGTYCNIFRQFVESGVPVNNLFCITGKSDISLKQQTQNRLPEMLKKNVFHGPDLTTRFVKSIEGKKDCVIILDECQCASGQNNSVLKALKKAGLSDKAELYRRNIRIVLVSATPNGTLYDIQKWGEETYKIIRGIPGDDYTSCIDLLAKARVFEALNLLERENIIELGNRIIKYDENRNDPLYHITRAYTGVKFYKMKDLFIECFGNLFEYINYTHEKNTKDINDILSVRPNKHTIIFIKEKLRCGKSLVKTHVGVMYDRPATFTDDSVVIQGLMGRATGYNDNGKTIIYCNIQSLINYVPLIESGDFSPEYTDWNSSSTEIIGNTIHGKQTFADPAHYKGTGVLAAPKAKREPKTDALYIIVSSFKELKDCYIAFNDYKYGAGHKKKGPNAMKKTPEGFHLGTIRKNSNVVLSLNQVLREKNNALNEKSPCRFKPCYRNVKDPNTAVFVFIHREPDFHYPTIITV